MKGFSQRWVDFPDYILGITEEIWEKRGIATLDHYYADDVIVRMPSGTSIGDRASLNSTLAVLAELPDRQLLGEDVIWSGSDEAGDLLSSHRILSTATHSRDGIYGKATGAPLRYRIIADCAARDDQIYDEWLIRDNGAIARQVGWEIPAFARHLIAQEGGLDSASQPYRPYEGEPVHYTGRGNDHEAGQRYADTLNAMMRADFATIERDYDRACQIEMPGYQTGHGWAAIDGFWLSLRAAFPDAAFEIHHQIGREDGDGFPTRAAIRWSLTGRHEGYGPFGPPSGADVHIMGASHAEFGPWGLRREFVLYDEVSIWKQILLATG
ncbi:MAG: ester cyclase [Devosiaceae bacterium]|nr:ester cyclase [Devosiaceae bacterium MH13]